MKTKRLIGKILIFSVLLISVLLIYNRYLHYKVLEQKSPSVTFRAIKVNNNKAWGYEIYIKNELFIRQSQIPCISSITGFKSREDAEKVATIVSQKIKENKLPAVSIEELKNLNVIYQVTDTPSN